MTEYPLRIEVPTRDGFSSLPDDELAELDRIARETGIDLTYKEAD